MKVNTSSLLSLVALAALIPTLDSAPADTCDDQSKCIEFTLDKLDSDACGVGGDCPVEVCMILSAGTSNNYGNCPKAIGGGGFSHVCTQSNNQGCAQWNPNNSSEPLLGRGNTGTCSASGEGSGATMFDGKCEHAEYVKMCQEGAPGDRLYWIVKDGSDDDYEAPETYHNFTWRDPHDCNATVECWNYEFKCGGGGSTVQNRKERVWSFLIPESDGGNCDPCTEYAPTPVHPPTPPVTEPTLAPQPPINSPTLAPAPSPVNDQGPTPGTNGDPHFKTWKNEHYEYHGQCDMVLTKDDNFADGLGLDIQIRTKLVRFWSYIRNAAIRIGTDIIELEGSTDPSDQSIRYWYNMQFQDEGATTLGGFPMTIRRVYSMMTKIEIDLDSKYPGVKIVMSTYKEFIKVEFVGATERAFGNTVGLLGDFNTGKTLARDGSTEIHDLLEFGNEWQITPTDNMLFHSTEEPQFPERCVVPEDPRGDRRRRLSESGVTLEQAEAACSKLKDEMDRKDCVYDILATQDIGMAGAF